MEEFKIIQIPTQIEEDETEDDRQVIEEQDEKPRHPRRRGVLVVLILLLFVIIALVVIRTITCYTDFEVQNSWERQDSAESKYISFKNNLLKYSSDGVFYTKYNGTLIWNYTYDMISPVIDSCGDYAVIYDKNGNVVELFSQSGHINTIKTTAPVVSAQIASKGTVALLLEEKGTTYIQLYDSDGTNLAAGEMHPVNGNYPIAIALSDDATRLLLSSVNISGGIVSSVLTFYDFTDEGKQKEDNIIATYTYEDLLIPEVDYVKGGRALAIGDSKILIFNNNSTASLSKEIELTESMKSVFHNDSYIGYVSEVANEDGELVNQLSVYNWYGFRCTAVEIDISYSTIELLSNNEVLFNDIGDVAIYNLQGFKKFSYSFEGNVYKIIPGTNSRRYIVVEEKKTEEIHLR